MQIIPSVLEEVQRHTADVLQIEIDEITPESQFFGDLGGESIELLELKFRLEKQFGVRVALLDFKATDIELDEQGRLTASSLSRLKTKFPFLRLTGYETRRLERRTDLLTIEAIAGFVQMALDFRQASMVDSAAPRSV
jgi:acyl carrier protein